MLICLVGATLIFPDSKIKQKKNLLQFMYGISLYMKYVSEVLKQLDE